jgi:hypothetical protein
MTEEAQVQFFGIAASPKELELIEGIIKDCWGLSRSELACTVCELLGWRRPNGRLKQVECRMFLERLEEKGMLRLPPPRGPRKKNRVRPATLLKEEDLPPQPVEGTVTALGPVNLEIVKTQEDRRLWRGWVDQYHYLGYKVPFGAHLCYFVGLEKAGRVGCIQVSSPAWRMKVRDAWIGWDDKQRLRGLQHIVQNSRFLILPHVRVPNLASTALAALARRIVDDWHAHYGIRPLLLETFVDVARFKGTIYKAANWIPLGLTTGRGRMDREWKRVGEAPKDVYVFPLCRKAREKLKSL